MEWVYVSLVVLGITSVAFLAKLADRRGVTAMDLSLTLFGASTLLGIGFLLWKPAPLTDVSLTSILTAGIAGMCGGLAVFAFNAAIRRGPFGFSNAIYRSSFIVPVVFSLLFLAESLRTTTATGIISVLAGVFLMSWSADSFDVKQPSAFRWFLVILTAFLLSGGPRIGQTLTARWKLDYGLYLFVSYLAGFLVLTVPALIRRRRFSLKSIPFGTGAAAGSFLAVFCTLKSLETLPKSVVFPVTLSGPIVLGTLLSLSVFRERIRPAGWIGIALAVAGILVLSILR
jgi:drug/metabolite transporter (DMT)-like permease